MREVRLLLAGLNITHFLLNPSPPPPQRPRMLLNFAMPHTVVRLIHEFKAGLLPLTDGTTLRTFLSIMLNCDPMRISKKFVGSNCIGKQVSRWESIAELHVACLASPHPQVSEANRVPVRWYSMGSGLC